MQRRLVGTYALGRFYLYDVHEENGKRLCSYLSARSDWAAGSQVTLSSGDVEVVRLAPRSRYRTDHGGRIIVRRLAASATR